MFGKKEQPQTNLPDVLGAITKGVRLEKGDLQLAIATRPNVIVAGKPFAFVVVAQSVVDCPIDMQVEIHMPERDLKGNNKRFSISRERLLVGLEAAEVGFVVLPALTQPLTAPGDYGFEASFNIKKLERGASRVRSKEGGKTFDTGILSDEKKKQFAALQKITYHAESAARLGVKIAGSFRIAAPKGPGMLSNLAQPQWFSLWTMRDHMDETALLERVKDQLDVIKFKLNRDPLFFPIMNKTQEHFEASGYPLNPGEAVLITKLLTLIMEQYRPNPENSYFPPWYMRVARILYDEPRAADHPEYVMTEMAYEQLLRDAVKAGFEMVTAITGQKFGTAEEITQYGQQLSQSLMNKEPVGFTNTYLPLVLGGLISNKRVTMPREVPRDTAELLQQELNQRRGTEYDEESQMIFDVAGKLIDRELDSNWAPS